MFNVTGAVGVAAAGTDRSVTRHSGQQDSELSSGQWDVSRAVSRAVSGAVSSGQRGGQRGRRSATDC